MRSSATFDRAACRATASSLIACLAFAAGAPAWADDDAPGATPYRPSVSTPAALSAPGWLEVEAGLISSRADEPTRRQSLPYTLKLAFTPDWGARIGGDAIVHQVNADGSKVTSGGDTSIVLKRRFAVSEASAFGLELGTKLPTASRRIGSGHADVGVNAIFSSDFAENWHTDINLLATHLGGTDAGMSAWQAGWAAAVSRNLSEAWGATGELSGTHQRGNGSTSQALLAASYALSKAASLDIGVSKGLSAASGGWSVFSGVTFLAARLF
ncbi:hypothetical protein BH11PSE9_BH11PSE9_01740 [soil metagenome]